MKTQRLVVNQKNNKMYRTPNHFPMGICISIEFNKASQNLEIYKYKNLTGE
jgi:hypothetical protein